jgi:hypothetical protein
MGIRAVAFLGPVAIVLALVACGGETSTAEQGSPAAVESATGGPGKTERPIGVKRTCSARSEADFPGAFTSAHNLVIGPQAMIGASGQAGFEPDFGGNKFPLLVENSHRVTLELPRRTHRRGAALAYGRLRQDRKGVRRGYRVITFVACQDGEPSGSSADGTPVTFWSGGILVRSRRCVPLRVWVDEETAAQRVVIRMGVRRCA